MSSTTSVMIFQVNLILPLLVAIALDRCFGSSIGYGGASSTGFDTGRSASIENIGGSSINSEFDDGSFAGPNIDAGFSPGFDGGSIATGGNLGVPQGYSFGSNPGGFVSGGVDGFSVGGIDDSESFTSGGDVSGSFPTGGDASGGFPTGGDVPGGFAVGDVSGGFPTGGEVSGGFPTGGDVSGGFSTGGNEDYTGSSSSGGYGK